MIDSDYVLDLYSKQRLLYDRLRIKKRVHLYLIIGKPGSGKTSAAARLAQIYLRKGRKVYSNVPILGTIKYTKDDLGNFDISGTATKPCLILLDEAGLEYDNRNFAKNFTQKSLEWWKLYRHYCCDIYIFSQTADVDLKLRALADGYFIVKKTPFTQFTFMQYAEKDIGVNKDTKQLEDHYKLIPFKYKVMYTRPARKLFDTHLRSDLPTKSFETWQ